ncbi:MAG: hypothetical protein CVU87_14215 [Firmicutes bacterium HGW-Firmicutes-12]|nr:MAG: hypothetical protein CVU87_14215 [Firmicutes bacterium HGW-Firmicutes-12]
MISKAQGKEIMQELDFDDTEASDDKTLGLEIEDMNKTIQASVRDIALTYYDRTCKYKDGIPTIMREIERVGDGDKKVWNITVRELNGKEMKVVKEYTEPLEE